MKNRTLIIMVIVLAIASGLFLMKDRFSTVRPELKDFAVKDTANITRIFLANRSGKEVTLERKGKGEWILNGKEKVKNMQMRILLETIYKVDVRTPVSKHAYNNVVKRLASNSIKCEIYVRGNDKPEKVYYVGGSTEDVMGTFMMIEGSSTPFITEIPGFNGYLTSRYSVEASDYKETAFLRAGINEVKSVSVSYRNYPENSFMVAREGNRFSVHSYRNDVKGDAVPADSIAVQNFVLLLESLYVESWIADMPKTKSDSITAEAPAITVKLVRTNDSLETVRIYPMPLNEHSLTQEDENGNKLKYDLDKVYGFVQPENQWSVIQHFNFDRILRRLQDFDVRQAKKSNQTAPLI